MIKLYLPTDFDKNPVIDDIYEKIANKIYKNGVSNISFTYKGQKRKFNSVQDLKNFLLSKDFYEYKFVYNSNFMQDLLKLSPTVTISGILNKKPKNEEAKKFIKKYNEDFKSYYNGLELYRGLNISKFKKYKSHSYFKDFNLVSKKFAYNQLSSQNRHSILNEMNVPVCPYCNMNYTIGYKKNGSIKNTADIDHFYVKSKYPEYALCLYNFVPACPVCNQKIKGATGMTIETHIYPHRDSFEGKSHFQITNLAEYLNQKSTDNLNAKLNLINIIIDKLIEDKVENSIKDFELNERYKYFSHYVEKLIENVQIYNESYNNVLIKSFDDLITEDRIKYAIFGANLSEEEYGKISLGKLKQDILYQLGIFESIEYD